MSKFKVGDVLFYAGRWRGEQSREVTLTKVGRKWLTFGNGRREQRADAETLIVQTNYGSPGKLYRSKQDYDDEREAEGIWEKIGRVAHSRGRGVDIGLTELRQIAQRLGVPLTEPTP